jgi:hypothetical protein
VKDVEPSGKEPTKTSVTEWLFADETGKIAEDVNLHEIDAIYNGYLQ